MPSTRQQRRRTNWGDDLCGRGGNETHERETSVKGSEENESAHIPSGSALLF
jgi:hypothetical protein